MPTSASTRPAQLNGAQVLWLPSIRPGISYNKHDGPLQASDGTITPASRSSLEAGLGTWAVGSGTPDIPGVVANFRVADALYQPRIAGHEVAARRGAANAATNDILLDVAIAYLNLLRAFQQQAIAEDTLHHAQRLAEVTAAFARTGQGSQADADRAQAELSLRQNAVAQADEQSKVASARLVELLSLDPLKVLVPEEANIIPIDLVPADQPVAELVARGLKCRPELAESHQLVAEAVQRLERERYAPLIPSVLLGVSEGGFGGGPGGNATSDFGGRFDLDAIAYWEIRNFGAGEVTARREAHARLEQAKLRQIQVMDHVAREIVEARAQVESRRGQMAVAQNGIRAATDSYQRNVQRIQGGQGLPIEVLQSIQALDQNRREYLRTVGDYDESQFRLYRALGCPVKLP